MTDTGQMASSTEIHGSMRNRGRSDDKPVIELVPLVRLVQPGSWCACTRCRHTIDFVPGGKRTLVALATYIDAALQSVELFHASCYDEAKPAGS